MSKLDGELADQIEQLVRAHLEATHRAVSAAVERAFSPEPARSRVRGRAGGERTKVGRGPRRSRAELSALTERVYELVCSQPGETMLVLAPQLGATSRELERPMKALRQSGRVRRVGQRHLTRYFPALDRTTADDR